jgi:release factor glutamine methyltransferase
MNARILSPYEKTQLARHNKANADVTGAMPIEYVTGKADFCGLQFTVNPSVLIPRVETEGLVELALQAITEKDTADTISILDVGTGSGAIIVSIAKHVENSPFKVSASASDLSEAALQVAKQNAENITSLPIQFFISDLLENVTEKFDLITANLPYIPSEAVKSLEESVINFEPLMALDGGSDGFSLVKEFLHQAQPKLKLQGTLILEVDPSHTASFFDHYRNDFRIEFFNDCFDRHRFVRLDLKN